MQEIRYPINNLKTLRVQRTANGKFAAEELLKEVETRTEVVSGVVNGSFWNAGLEAGLTEAQMLTLANNIFSYDIDFGLDIKAGDSFSVILRPVMPTVNLLVTGIFSPHSLKTKARCIRQFVTRTALFTSRTVKAQNKPSYEPRLASSMSAPILTLAVYTQC